MFTVPSSALLLSRDEILDTRKRLEAACKADPVTGCWVWQKGKVSGYGCMRRRGIRDQHLAHRMSYAAFVGEIPDRAFVLHRCDNPPCCNPDHLFLGDHWDNMRDMRAKQRHSHGARNGTAKLTESQVLEIRADTASTGRALAIKYGVSASAISEIKIGRGWRLAGGKIRPKQKCGESRPDAKLTASAVRAIRSDHRTQRVIAARYGVTRECISRIKRGIAWKHLLQENG